MTHNNRNNFTAKGICEILKACAESGVTRLKLGDLDVDFTKPAIAVEPDTSLEQVSSEEIIEQDAKATKTQAFQLLKDNQKLEDDRIDNLQIEDPFQYEEMLTQGVLEDAEA